MEYCWTDANHFSDFRFVFQLFVTTIKASQVLSCKCEFSRHWCSRMSKSLPHERELCRENPQEVCDIILNQTKVFPCLSIYKPSLAKCADISILFLWELLISPSPPGVLWQNKHSSVLLGDSSAVWEWHSCADIILLSGATEGHKARVATCRTSYCHRMRYA